MIAFGDSITVGTGATRGFILRIADATGAQIENHATGSSRIADHLILINSTPIPPNSCVIYLVGMNDMIQNGDDPTKLDVYLVRLKQALDLWDSQDTEVYVGLPLRLTLNGLIFEAISKNPISAYTPELYSQAITKLVKGESYRHIHLVDTHTLYEPTDQNTSDGIHPNDLGSQIIASAFLMYM